MSNFYFETLTPGGGRYLADGKWITMRRGACISYDNGNMLQFQDDNFVLNMDITIDSIYIDNGLQVGGGKTVQANIHALFPEANSGSGGSGDGGTTAFTVEKAATKSAVSASTDSRLVRVASDESNNFDRTLYLYTNGVGLEFLLTFPTIS